MKSFFDGRFFVHALLFDEYSDAHEPTDSKLSVQALNARTAATVAAPCVSNATDLSERPLLVAVTPFRLRGVSTVLTIWDTLPTVGAPYVQQRCPLAVRVPFTTGRHSSVDLLNGAQSLHLCVILPQKCHFCFGNLCLKFES